jgi:type IV pilus assembly protein PilV
MNRSMEHRRHAPAKRRQAGVTMLEVLVSLLVIVLGLLGLAGLQVRMQSAEFESYQRTQAVILLYDMVERINANTATTSCFVFTDTSTGAPYLGAGSSALAPCAVSTVANNAMADASKVEWDGLLKGAAEVKGGVAVGAMIGARGCVSYDAATELLDGAGAAIPGTGIYTVAVAWQGTVDTVVPSVNCGNGQYTAEARRRVVSTTFRRAKLS